MAENASELPVSERQEMGLLVTPAINAAGRPYDPETGKLLPASSTVEPIHSEKPTVNTTTRHSAELYDSAAYFGLSEADADSVDSKTLQKMLRRMQHEHATAREAQDRARFWEAQQGPKGERSPVNTPAPEPEFDLGEELDPNANPKTFGLLKRLAEKEKLLDQKLSKLEEREGSRTQQAYYDAWDDAFASIADPRLGEGSREELEQDSDALRLRQRLIQASGIDMSKHTPAQTKRLIAKAYKDFYPEGAPVKAKPKPAEVAAAGYGGEPDPTPAPKASKKPAITTEQWDRGGVGAPTRRAPEQLPEGRDRAIAAVAAKLGQQAPNYDQDQEIKSTLLKRNGTPTS